MRNFFDDWDRECLFEITSEDVLKIDADVLVLKTFTGVAYHYVIKNTKHKKEIESEVRAKFMECNSPDVKKDFSSHYLITSGYDLQYKHIVHTFIPMINDNSNDDECVNFSHQLVKIMRNILNYATEDLKAERIVFAFPGFDVQEKDFELYRPVAATINTFIRTECPYLKVCMAVPPSCCKKGQVLSEPVKEIEVPVEENIALSLHNMIQSNNISELLEKVRQNVPNPVIYSEYFRKLQVKKQESNVDHKQFAKDIVSGYLRNYKGSQVELAEMVDCAPSEISRYTCGANAPRYKERALAIALAIGLHDEDMFIFMNGAGFNYPDGFRDNIIELLHNSGEYDYYTIKNVLDKANEPLVKDRDALKEEKAL